MKNKLLINIFTMISILCLFFSKYFVIILLIMILLINNINLFENKKNVNKIDLIDTKLFINEKKRMKKQIDIFNKNKKILDEILILEFGNTSLTYAKFNNVIINIDKLFNDNIDEIMKILKNTNEEIIIDSKNLKIFNKIYTILQNNDIIIEKLNQLIMEIGKLNSLLDINEISLNELENLILDTKIYKEAF